MLKTICKTLATQSWNYQQQLLRSASISVHSSRKFRLSAQSWQELKDYEHFHEQMKSLKPSTMVEFLGKTVAEFGDHPALMHRKEGSSEWTPVTYKQYKSRTEQIAKAFIKLGLEKDGKVAVLAFNSPEWLISQFAAMHAGGQIVGIYITNSSSACLYVLNNSRATIVVVDSDEQLNKILEIKDQLPHLKAIVKTLAPHNVEGVWKWSDLEAMSTEDVEAEYRLRVSQVRPSDCCSVSYTSGTTGNPKGVLISHDNFTWEIETLTTALQSFRRGEERGIAYLPLAHMAGQLSEILMAVWSGATIYFADKDAFRGTLIGTMRAARPTYFVSVPRVYEKIQARLQQVIGETRGLKGTLLNWARGVTLDHHIRRLESGPHFSLRYELAKKLVLNKVKASLGLEECRSFFIGSAPVSFDTTKFFMSLDIHLQEVYGMTEGTGISFMRARWHRKLDTLGKVLPGLEAKIVNPNEQGFGEICTRGRNIFMGYNNEPEKTRETLDEEGWLSSGDVGYLDSEGFLFITGRMKEIIVTAGGENVPYLHIESLVKLECPAISNTFLVGDRRKFVSLLLTLRTEMNSEGAPCDELAPESLKLMRDVGVKHTLLSEVLDAGPEPKVMAALQAAVDRANDKAISNAQKIKKFAILPGDFSVATDELNAAMKLKRNAVLEKYKHIIDSFYA